MPPALNSLMYLDDSGHQASGLIVYGWVRVHPDRWADVLGSWLDMRKRLWRHYRIPVTQELHTTHYVHGRGRIAKHVPDRHIHNGVEFWKDFGRDVATECLDALRSTEGLRVGAVYRRGAPSDFNTTKTEAYSTWVASLETELAADESLALLFMDGDGTDVSYRTAHRGLPLRTRRVIEDAVHLDSRHSQLVQMADHVAWCAYTAIERPGNNEFAWNWYERYLSERDTSREPQEI